MREITAEEAREIKIPDDVKEQHRISAEDLEKEMLDIKSVESWPLWPILPMKNVMWRHVDSRLPWSALMIAVVDNESNLEKRVYLANTFELRGRGLTNTDKIRDKVEFLEYKTWKEMIEAGWRVD